MWKGVVTNVAQTGTLMAAGDLIAQVFIEKKAEEGREGVDWKRTARFAGFGFCVAGPLIGTWYRVLDRYVGSKGPRVALTKVLLDQTLMAPTFLTLFLGFQNVTQGRSASETRDDVRHKLPTILASNYKIWPWVQLTNFYFVPLRYQLLYVQSFAVVWNTYLSWKVNNFESAES